MGGPIPYYGDTHMARDMYQNKCKNAKIPKMHTDIIKHTKSQCKYCTPKMALAGTHKCEKT